MSSDVLFSAFYVLLCPFFGVLCPHFAPKKGLYLCPSGGDDGLKKKKDFSEELKQVLALPASEDEITRLSDMKITVKNPTRMTVIAASIYKKAAGGELSAIKELLSVIGVGCDKTGGVTLVDDIGKP